MTVNLDMVIASILLLAAIVVAIAVVVWIVASNYMDYKEWQNESVAPIDTLKSADEIETVFRMRAAWEDGRTAENVINEYLRYTRSDKKVQLRVVKAFLQWEEQ